MTPKYLQTCYNKYLAASSCAREHGKTLYKPKLMITIASFAANNGLIALQLPLEILIKLMLDDAYTLHWGFGICPRTGNYDSKICNALWAINNRPTNRAYCIDTALQIIFGKTSEQTKEKKDMADEDFVFEANAERLNKNKFQPGFSNPWIRRCQNTWRRRDLDFYVSLAKDVADGEVPFIARAWGPEYDANLFPDEVDHSQEAELPFEKFTFFNNDGPYQPAADEYPDATRIFAPHVPSAAASTSSSSSSSSSSTSSILTSSRGGASSSTSSSTSSSKKRGRSNFTFTNWPSRAFDNDDEDAPLGQKTTPSNLRRSDKRQRTAAPTTPTRSSSS
tara:strand:- start:466 stop:1470 length:1005 start_codon:yes stop_codon:yes gene_type:complete